MNLIAFSNRMKRDGQGFWSEYQTVLLKYPDIVKHEIGLAKVAYALANVNKNTEVSGAVLELILD